MIKLYIYLTLFSLKAIRVHRIYTINVCYNFKYKLEEGKVMNTQHNLKIVIVSIFVLVYGAFFTVVQVDKNNRINTILEEHVEKLNTHYHLIQNYFFLDANIIKNKILNDKKIQIILQEASVSSKNKKAHLREELYKYLTPLYTSALKRGIYQLQFVFSDNTSFLRSHKPDKYGDNLSAVRYSFLYANSQKKDVWGFEQGRTTHAFRYVFPFYNEKGNHIGAVEISLSSSFIQKRLIEVSKLHTHFLVNKKILGVRAWKTKNLGTHYIPSIENKNYMYSIVDKIHTEEKNKLEQAFVNPYQKYIAQQISLKKHFSFYHCIDNNVKVISFLPIKNIKDKEVVAYLVSYSDDHTIYDIQTHYRIFLLTIFFISMFTVYIIYVSLQAKKELEIYEKIISQTKSHLSFLDTNYTYKAVNTMYLLAHNKTQDEIVGHSVLEILGEDVFKEYVKEKLDLCLSGEEVHYSKWFKTDGLGDIYMDVSYYPYLVNGRVEGIVVSSNDITQLHLTQEKLKELANKDQLTNLYNRRYFYNVVENIIHLEKRAKSNLSIIMIDIDKFKNVNDTYGHTNGDIVIKSLASLLLEHTRASDIVARIGGEEFVVLLPDTPQEAAFKFANKLRLYTERLIVFTVEGFEIQYTISLGVAQVDLENEKTIQKALMRADKALYEAKENGRNKVC